jgi:hypothetical protein
MSTAVLLAGLVDDAALFPPGNAPIDVAVREHREHRASSHAALVGRFLCPASRLAELSGELPADETLRLGVIVDYGMDGIEKALREAADEPRFIVELVEVPLPAEVEQRQAADDAADALQHAPLGAQAFVELPRVRGWRDALGVLAERHLGAKLRTGGTVASAFPSDEEVIAFLQSCAAANVPFKCTAGLHEALRHRDPATGFRHHGFLNILAATCSVAEGTDGVAALTETDAVRLVSYLRSVDAGTAAQARRLFVSYGSCSIDEPVHDLVALGLLDQPAI